MSIAEESLRAAGLFEAELLVELMLRYWNHPFAANAAFRNDLLEAAVSALEASVRGEHLVEGLTPQNVSLVAAVWYAEWSSLTNDPSDEPEHLPSRRDWADNMRRALPSCFCDPEFLP